MSTHVNFFKLQQHQTLFLFRYTTSVSPTGCLLEDGQCQQNHVLENGSIRFEKDSTPFFSTVRGKKKHWRIGLQQNCSGPCLWEQKCFVEPHSSHPLHLPSFGFSVGFDLLKPLVLFYGRSVLLGLGSWSTDCCIVTWKQEKTSLSLL